MDVVLGILIVIVFLLVVAGPMLRRWFGPMLERWAMGKMEDRMRRMAGMPTRKEERKARRQAERQRDGAASRFRQAAAGSRRSRRQPRSTVGMLKYVAEDVEFTEIKEFGGDTMSHETAGRVFRQEEQIEDADYVEIKEKEK